MKHRGWLKIGRDNFDRSEIWMECAQKRTARRKSDMENYAAVESVSAGSWNDCFSSSFISACHHARFPCKRRGPATRRAWSKSNQLDFKLSVTLAAFFHPPSPSSSLSSYFPFHHRDLMHLKCVSKISSFFFKKKKLGKQFDLIRNSDRNEGKERKNIPSNGKIVVDEKRGKEVKNSIDEFQTRRYLLDCYCCEGTFFFLLLGETIYIYPASRALFASEHFAELARKPR